MKNKRGREARKNLVCYSQALELDVELLHLHFIPWLQLKRNERLIITANIALYGDEAEVACDCYATCCWISKVAQKEPEYQFHTDMSSNTDSLLVSVTPKETIVWFGAQQPVGLATTWRPNVNKSSGEIIHLYSFIYLILYFRRRGHEQIWL